jgi:hypothetical protein
MITSIAMRDRDPLASRVTIADVMETAQLNSKNLAQELTDISDITCGHRLASMHYIASLVVQFNGGPPIGIRVLIAQLFRSSLS